MKYSVIVLLEEQHKDFFHYLENLYLLFSSLAESFEILIIANGTGGFLRKELQKLQYRDERLKAFELNTKVPQAVCLKAALKESNGNILVVCGSYQQLANDTIRQLLEHFDEETDIISPWRQRRVDPSFNQLQSRFFNTLVRWITDSALHDLNCTVRIFRREVIEETKLYGNMYRFLPILAARKGFKTKEIGCGHYQERGKIGFYSPSEYLTRLIDILTLYFNTRFTRKPLRFFASLGLGFLLFGVLISLYVFVEKIFLGHPLGDRPLLPLAVLSMVLGVQAASVGLLGEIIAFSHGRHRKEYTIQTIV